MFRAVEGPGVRRGSGETGAVEGTGGAGVEGGYGEAGAKKTVLWVKRLNEASGTVTGAGGAKGL